MAGPMKEPPRDSPGSQVPRVPLGTVGLRRSASDLDALSVITAEDVEAARVMWRRHAPDGSKGLIDAKTEEGSA